MSKHLQSLRYQQRDSFLSELKERVQVMGILNVTPDSFSDGGQFNAPKAALSQALRMEKEGADILDIGAESTRPGSTPLSAQQEWSRLEPVLSILSERVTRPLSLDTYKAEIAEAALSKGYATFINDVWGLQKDPDMAVVVAEYGAGLIVMHNRETRDPAVDILQDIRRFFADSLKQAKRAGIEKRHIILDPGIGFGKTFDQNLTILGNLDHFKSFGCPLLIGLSRKSFLGQLLGAPVEARLTGTLVANMWSMMQGAQVIRVHDVEEHVTARRVLERVGPNF